MRIYLDFDNFANENEEKCQLLGSFCLNFLIDDFVDLVAVTPFGL